MRFIESTLPLALAITSVVASGAPAPTETDPVEIFVQEYAAGEMEVDTSFSIGNETEHLEKREHHECWGNGLYTVQNQQAYEDDCDGLVYGLKRSARSHLLQRGGSVKFVTAANRCKIIVRNESNCNAHIFFETDAGRYAEDTLSSCPSLTQCSGWGYLGSSITSKLIYIIEPSEYAPPTYSPRC